MPIGSMTSQELASALQSESPPLLIDCRELGEWREGHIAQAEHIPLSNFPEELQAIVDKSQKIVVQCRSGKRSMKACEYMVKVGYTTVFNLEGGILDWQESGLPITND